jgi:hypothetical protein
MSTSNGVQKRNAFAACAAFRIEGLEASLNHAREIAVREELDVVGHYIEEAQGYLAQIQVLHRWLSSAERRENKPVGQSKPIEPRAPRWMGGGKRDHRIAFGPRSQVGLQDIEIGKGPSEAYDPGHVVPAAREAPRRVGFIPAKMACHCGGRGRPETILAIVEDAAGISPDLERQDEPDASLLVSGAPQILTQWVLHVGRIAD